MCVDDGCQCDDGFIDSDDDYNCHHHHHNRHHRESGCTRITIVASGVWHALIVMAMVVVAAIVIGMVAMVLVCV